MPGYDAGQQALYVPGMSPFVMQATRALSANRVCVVRFVAPRAATIKRASFHVTTAAGADDQCDVGIYSSDLQTKLGSSGAVSGKLNALGVSIVSMQSPIPLTGGVVYYAAFGTPATFGGSAAAVVSFTWADLNPYRFFGGAAPQIECSAQSPVAGVPLPAALTINQGPGAQFPLLALLET